MASISNSHPPPLLIPRNPTSSTSSSSSLRSSLPSIISFPSYRTSLLPRFRPLRTESDGGRVGCVDAQGPELLRKPVTSPVVEQGGELTKKRGSSDVEEPTSERPSKEEWIDWEDKILEDTVPLVGFVRMILHSGRYQSGERLSAEHEKPIVERLLPYHPEYEKKVGSGIDYIKVEYHPEFENSRCLFIVRTDSTSIDFSYWKCIKGLIRKNYPLHADSFILRHFRMHKRSD